MPVSWKLLPPPFSLSAWEKEMEGGSVNSPVYLGCRLLACVEWSFVTSVCAVGWCTSMRAELLTFSESDVLKVDVQMLKELFSSSDHAVALETHYSISLWSILNKHLRYECTVINHYHCIVLRSFGYILNLFLKALFDLKQHRSITLGHKYISELMTSKEGRLRQTKKSNSFWVFTLSNILDLNSRHWLLHRHCTVTRVQLVSYGTCGTTCKIPGLISCLVGGGWSWAASIRPSSPPPIHCQQSWGNCFIQPP